MTQYSGIKPGDLDAKISSKHLTTLKWNPFEQLEIKIKATFLSVQSEIKNEGYIIQLREKVGIE